MKPFENIVAIEGADFYRKGDKILEGISFSLSRGEFCFISGPTGSGKSSFIEGLYGALTIKGGKAIVLDHDMHRISRNSLPYFRRKLGIVFQDAQLFMDWTVYENLDFVLRATDWKDNKLRKRRIDEVLEQVSFDKSPDITPSKLSGGERQIISIARAVLNKPRLILADEPTGNLDFDSTTRVIKLLVVLAKEYKASAIVATHDQNLLQKFPARTYTCHNKQLIEKPMSFI